MNLSLTQLIVLILVAACITILTLYSIVITTLYLDARRSYNDLEDIFNDYRETAKKKEDKSEKKRQITLGFEVPTEGKKGA